MDNAVDGIGLFRPLGLLVGTKVGALVGSKVGAELGEKL
jgi:hypothetical protein